MSKDFAEKVLDTIYAKATENGGSCRISRRQFDIVTEYLEPTCTFPNGIVPCFYGNLGKYFVELHDECTHGCCCEKIILRDEAEVEAERKSEAEAKAAYDAVVAGFKAGNYVGQPKKRMDFTLTVTNIRQFEGYYGMTNLYEMADEDGNCIVWFTGSIIECYDEESDEWLVAEVGDKVSMRATVKEHKEYRGIKQTVVNRPKVNSIN